MFMKTVNRLLDFSGSLATFLQLRIVRLLASAVFLMLSPLHAAASVLWGG
jgi:hypothetical protein